jgi:site-specific DNA recombinase
MVLGQDEAIAEQVRDEFRASGLAHLLSVVRSGQNVRLDGYIRVSRVGGRSGESFMSPDVQRQQIEGWARLRGVEIAEWHTDLDQTGGKLGRPGLDRALERLKAGQTDGIAVAKVDRFSRAGVADALKVIEEIHDLGGELAAVDFGIDPTTPFGEFGMTLLLGLARMQRRQIGETWDTARARAVARGVHIASKTPTGYLRREDGRLEPHPAYAPHVTEVFRMRAAGDSWRTLSDYLNANGVVGPYGSPLWRTRATTHLIANRVYLGEARSGEHVKPHAHEPLIDVETWERAQRAKSAPPAKGEGALLAGLLRCAGCRHTLKPDRMTARGETLRIYRCRGEHSSGVCPDRSAVLGRVIEPWVERHFFARADWLQQTAALLSQTTADLERLVDDVRAELIAYRDNESIAALGEVYVDGMRVRAERVAEADRELSEARGTVVLPDVGEVELRAVYDDSPVVVRQKYLRAAIGAVMLRSGRSLPIDDRALILWADETPDDLPRRGKRFPLRSFDWPDVPDGAGVAAS